MVIRTARAGFTVMEALIALLVGWVLCVLALGAFARQRDVQNRLAHRAEVLAALRTARYVLDAEVRAGDGTEAVGSDTLALRAYRGVGLLCPADSGKAGPVRVRVEGMRAPDPGKDSVQVLTVAGAVAVLALVDRAPGDGPCPGAAEEAVERWSLSAPLPPGALLARYFERGSYHLSGRALRYRRGDAGRQPLTPEVLRTPPSSFARGAGTIRVELMPQGPEATRTLILDGGERVGSAPGGGPGDAPPQP